MYARRISLWLVMTAVLFGMSSVASGQPLDHQKLLEQQTFWDNRDWEWYRAHIPFFESPDPDLNTTYYYRWELLTKHLTYGSPNSGYLFTEFIDRPFWSGTYGAISCPAGHQLYEARWLRDPRVARDYARYWLRTPGAEPRRYSTWLADAAWAVHEVHPDQVFSVDLYPDLAKNHAGWVDRHFDQDVGLFWQNGHDDGMEYNIQSRQTQDILRGGPGYRPTLNSYLWADGMALSRFAELASQPEQAAEFRAQADAIKHQLQSRLWDPRREFFLHMAKNDEERDGAVVKAGTLTYKSGKFAGSDAGRELIGYVPWQFRLPDAGKGFEVAWKFLMNDRYFRAPFGPTTVEQDDPQFYLSPTCCWWSGMSWPYATSQTLKAMANLLQSYPQGFVTRDDYYELLRTFARSHRKNGQPYLAEALHPQTGSFEGHDAYNHSEHYFHSSFCDLVITGLVGLQTSPEDRIEVRPLAPLSWDYFALNNVAYHGRELGIYWDRTGTRYGLGPGFHLVVDGQRLVSSPNMEPLKAELPQATRPADAATSNRTLVNYAVNNDGLYYPRVVASSVSIGSSASKLIDGNYWYHQHPPNRWVASAGESKSRINLELGIPREITVIKLYFLDDGSDVVPPASLTITGYCGGSPVQTLPLIEQKELSGRKAVTYALPKPIEIDRLEMEFNARAGGRPGLTEVEVWGLAELPVQPAPPPAGNLAFDAHVDGWPRVTASYTSRFDQLSTANDGRISFTPVPANRWTAYESPDPTDCLEFEWQKPITVGRVDAYVYDDGGGVQAPRAIQVEVWTDNQWQAVRDPIAEPKSPQGGVCNVIRFAPIETKRLRCTFIHPEGARSGVTELEVWAQ